jgi:hypothetical protein
MSCCVLFCATAEPINAMVKPARSSVFFIII